MKKTGCFVITLVGMGIVLLGVIAGSGNENKDSGKVTIESSEKKDDKQSSSEGEASKNGSEADLSSQEESKAEKEFSYEITDTNFHYYTNSIGSTEYYGYVEILNTGTKNIYLDDCTFDLEDNDGHLLQSDSLISSCPDIIAPGEKGYFYNGIGSSRIDKSVSLDNGVKLVPNFKVEEAKGDIVDYEVTDTDIRESTFGSAKVTGRVKNTTEEDDSYLYINFVFYDENEKVIGISGTSVTDLAAGSTASFEASTDFFDKELTVDNIKSYKVIARKEHYQF